VTVASARIPLDAYLLRRLGSFEAAADAYRRALVLMANGVERRLAEL
jgi:predicted RNA polymerase sigma factor